MYMTVYILWLWPKWYPYDIQIMPIVVYDEWYQCCMISYDWLGYIYFRHIMWLMSEFWEVFSEF